MARPVTRLRAWAPVAGLAASLSLGACLEPPSFSCKQDVQCNANGAVGICDLTGICIYDAPGCPSGFATADGTCAMGMLVDTDSSTPGDGGNGDSDGSDGGGGGTTTTGGATTVADVTDSSDPSTTTGEMTTGVDGCADAVDITDEGVVGADSTFDEFEPALSVDADLSTSWFSTGPEGGNAPTNYNWTTAADRCIDRILIIGNAQHEDPGFRTDFGFESVTVRVFDASDNLVFEEARGLPGTPDPDTTVEVGTVGSRVVLALSDHEDDTCGGFSELQVLGEL